MAGGETRAVNEEMATIGIKNKNILVTGGAGFVGSHLTERLTEDNHVVVVDNLLYGSLENLKGVRHTFLQADLTQMDALEILREYDIDLVFHLAAFHLDDSLREPMKDFMISALGGLRLLDACRSKKVHRLVYTSTGSVYGQPESMGHREDHPLLPTTPYGISKGAMDHYCRVYNDLYGIETVILRYYNIYGPRRTAGAIPQFILRALEGGTIYIDGGEQTRTPTYVADIVDATVRAGSREGIGGQAFNIGAEEYITILDLAKMIVRLAGAQREVTLEMRDYRAGEIMHLRPDVTKAREILGWDAKVSLEEGLTALIDYLKKHHLGAEAPEEA